MKKGSNAHYQGSTDYHSTGLEENIDLISNQNHVVRNEQVLDEFENKESCQNGGC